MTTLAILLGVIGENPEIIGAVGGSLALWLRLEHRLTKLETLVNLLLAKKPDEK